MKSIITYINEQQIFESFNCDILKRADASIKNVIKIRKEEYQLNGRDIQYMTKLPSMNDFLRFSIKAQYDKITNDMVQSFKGGDKNAIKQIRKIFKADGPENVIAIGFLNGNIYCFANSYGTVYVYPANPSSMYKVLNYNDKQYMKMAPFVEADELYIITIDNKLINDANSKHNERLRDRQGMIYQGDADFYRQLARENVDRYKKIIAQNKAMFTDDSELLEKYEEVMAHVVRLSSSIAAQPDKLKNTFYTYKSLMLLVYGKMQYDNKGKSIGENGILYTFISYTDTKRDVLKDGGYEHQQRNLVIYRNNLKILLDKAVKYIDIVENEL